MNYEIRVKKIIEDYAYRTIEADEVVDRITDLIDVLLNMNATQRLALWFLDSSENGTQRFPWIPQTELADQLGLSRAFLSTICCDFASQKGYVGYIGRNEIEVLNAKALRKIALEPLRALEGKVPVADERKGQR